MTRPNLDPAIMNCLRQALGTSTSDVSDALLLQKFVDCHDKFAFELLVRRHFPSVHRVCFSVLRDHHGAEDAAQAVFMVFAKKAGAIRNPLAVVGWLVETAYRISKRAERRVDRRRPHASVHQMTDLPESREDKDFETEAILHRAIARLSEKHRDPILLCYFEGLSHVEAASRLGWPLGTLKARLERAKELLHREIERRGGVIPAAGIAAILVAPHTTVAASRISEIVAAACAFGHGQIQTGLAASLAHEALREVVIRRLSWAAIAIFCGTVGVFVSYGGVEQFAQPKSIPNTLPVLAPVHKHVIDPEVVASYEKSGAIYGGFVESIYEFEPKFQPGEDAAKLGLPGFLWLNKPKDLHKLPLLDRRFAWEFRCELNDSDFANIPLSNRLDTLIITSASLTDDIAPRLGRFAELRQLILPQAPMSTVCIAPLSKLEKLEHLTLQLNYGRYYERFARETKNKRDHDSESAAFKDFRQLKSLTLATNSLSKQLAEQLCELPQLDSLTLDLRRQPVLLATEHSFKQMKPLRRLRLLGVPYSLCHGLVASTKLELLEWEGIHNDRGVSQEDFDKLSSLRFLKLKMHEISDDLYEAITAMTNLRGLAIHTDKKLTGDCIRDLSHLKQLETLELVSGQWDNKSAKLLGSLPASLRRLKINHPRFSEDDLVSLASLNELRSLTLEYPRLGERSGSAIAVLSKLECLEIVGGSVSEEVVEGIAKLGQLRELRLEAVSITDASIRQLTSCHKLQSLTLLSEKLSVNSVESLTQLHSLRFLVVHADFADEVRKRLPRCHVTSIARPHD